MADVAQRGYMSNGLASRVLEASLPQDRSSRQRSRRQRTTHASGGSHVSDRSHRYFNRQGGWGESIPYPEAPLRLNVVAQPPQQVHAGQPFAWPFEVQIEGAQLSGHTSSLDMSGLFAVVTLMRYRPRGASLPAGPGLLTGPRLVSSFQSSMGFSDDDFGTSQAAASFQHLAINSEGAYSLRVSLLRMGSGPAGSAAYGASNIFQVESDPVLVRSG
ncbi:hypothetical protein K402DRAFT_391549 [Aulographum hederae CBS 113979]|uniref:Velvet domain-containing protein n=1 Tax=Aulographum hederae CBS 113979 TaxID=1176131 RepID=A0A6G1H6R8_9PEZI|nr:hypothetical protein K402DRAFT_391549 [Aulographum hederae CBS 113979]